MNKLYEVTIKLMVIAIDKDDAKYAAGDIDLYACDFEAKEITDINGCLPGWENAIPYGDQGSNDFTCAEIIDSL